MYKQLKSANPQIQNKNKNNKNKKKNIAMQINGPPENRRTLHERPRETTGELDIKCDAKFYVQLAACGKANVGLYSDIWSLIDS